MGIQSTETDDQNQLQAGMQCNICHYLFMPPDMNLQAVFLFCVSTV